MLEEKLAAQKISLGGLIPLIQKCKRAEEQKTFIWDPIYMWLGVAITAMLFPLPVAATSLMQVSLGDAAAALVGMQWGTYKVPWNTQKSWEGSFAFFLTAFLGSLCFVAWWQALIAALVGALIEQVPLKSADNFLIPVGVSLVLVLFI
jgi:phosphoserine phosphatase